MGKPAFNQLINNPETPVLVDFYANWCGPCQTMSPVLKELAQEFQGKLKVIKIDVDKNQQVANSFRIMGIPTFILFKNGQPLWRQSGLSSASALKKVINQYL